MTEFVILNKVKEILDPDQEHQQKSNNYFSTQYLLLSEISLKIHL